VAQRFRAAINRSLMDEALASAVILDAVILDKDPGVIPKGLRGQLSGISLQFVAVM
jgi:hypothetical protein